MHRLEVGFTIASRYRLESRIATGGMSHVWAAVDSRLQRKVAIKIMHPATADEHVFAQRFKEEALNAGKLAHVNIAAVFDYGEHEGLAFLVMELVQGVTLAELLRSNGALSAEQARTIVAQTALALEVAHQADIVHRDIKPANILIRNDGIVKLTDFGIARAVDGLSLTPAGEILGTPFYLSPEQALGAGATPASDLYSLGVVAHEILTGARPFDGGTPIATALAHVTSPAPPLPPSVPFDLAEIIGECLAKDPARRPGSARLIANRLGLQNSGARQQFEARATTAPSQTVGQPRSGRDGIETASSGERPARACVPRYWVAVGAVVAAILTFVATLALH